ncbi:hypothetical protein [Bartonella sp. ML70XJBT]|nr:hypothetical protein [Bartonella sp. ML70XJBT]
MCFRSVHWGCFGGGDALGGDALRGAALRGAALRGAAFAVAFV